MLLNNQESGFTVTEIIIVTIIVGVLAAVVIPKMSKVINKMKAQEAINILLAIFSALKNYALDHNGDYGNLVDLDITIPPLKYFMNIGAFADADVTFAGGNGPFELLGSARFKDNSFGVYLLGDGSIVCEDTVIDACKKSGFKIYYP